MSNLEATLLDLRIASIERRRTLIRLSQEIAPWISASLSELQPGHTGEYEKLANEFLSAVAALKFGD